MKKSLLSFSIMLMVALAAGNLRASVIYTPMNITANQTSTWNWFSFGVDADGFGLWVNAGSALRLETYQGKVIGTDDGGKVYLTALAYETEIGAGSAWLVPASPSYINDATHTDLNGKTVYVGVQLTAADAAVFYGWLQLVVSADGLSVTLTGMAYQDEPGASLKAGVIDRQASYATTALLEDLTTNDGTIGTTIEINLLAVDFALATGRLTPGTHYTATHVPAGLTLEIQALDAKKAVIMLAGQAAAHAQANAVNDLSVHFLDAAFTGATAAEVIGAIQDSLMVKFFNPYEIVYEDLPDLTCGVNGWAPFSNAYFGNEFGLWHDGTDQRIETYGKSIVGTSVAGKSYFTPIDEGVLIDESSAWVTTGNWPDEPYLNTGVYTAWNGKHKYAGIQLVVGEAKLFGWLNLEVSADGKTVTLLDWAFNSQPNGPIRAGQISSSSPWSEQGKIQLDLFPNPVQSSLVISLNTPLNVSAEVDILDVTGKVVCQDRLVADGSMKYLVNTGYLNRGIYFIRVFSTEIHYTGKLIRD